MITLGEIVLVHDLKRQGLGVTAIARQLGIDRKTVRKHLIAVLATPSYAPRLAQPRLIAPYEDYLRARIAAWPDLSGKRLLRELRERGYKGCYSVVTDFLRGARPPRTQSFERRFETAAGKQAQVDFAWFLFDTRRSIKPLIYQNRKAFELVRMDSPDDERVFDRREYRFGIDGRSNAGFGFWQLAFGSKQELDGASYAAARAAMQSFTADYGRPLGVVPDLLVVPPALEPAAREVLSAERTTEGATNVWGGTAEMLAVPWLA